MTIKNYLKPLTFLADVVCEKLGTSEPEICAQIGNAIRDSIDEFYFSEFE